MSVLTQSDRMTNAAFVIPTLVSSSSSPFRLSSSKWGVSTSPFQSTANRPAATRQQPPAMALSQGVRPAMSSKSKGRSTEILEVSKNVHGNNQTTIPASTDALFSSNTFSALGIDALLTDHLRETGITQPTTIQSRGMPPILGGVDVILGAATGSGKTLAYLLPIIQLLKQEEQLRTMDDAPLRVRRRPRSLVLVPTRELAEQVMAVARGLSHVAKFRVASAIGGTHGATKRLIERLESGALDILVATTGRLIQLLDSREVDLRFVSHIVIDEVDTMFDKGFEPEVSRILKIAGSARDDTKPRTQLIAAGATHPPSSMRIYADAFKDAKRVDVDLHLAPIGLEQRFVRVRGDSRLPELLSLVRDDEASASGVMVFCNTVSSCRFVEHYLRECDMDATSVHGEMPPLLRDAQYARFASGEVRVLVCTDMTGRGVDHANVSHVVLFDFPESAVDYVHRAGRTARAGAKGRVTGLVTKRDEALARALERAGRRRADALESERAARAEAEELRKRAAQAARERKAAGLEDGEWPAESTERDASMRRDVRTRGSGGGLGGSRGGGGRGGGGRGGGGRGGGGRGGGGRGGGGRGGGGRGGGGRGGRGGGGRGGGGRGGGGGSMRGGRGGGGFRGRGGSAGRGGRPSGSRG